MTVYLEKPEWDQILAILGKVPWEVANPLLMKIGGQLRPQYEHLAAVPGLQDQPGPGVLGTQGILRPGNSGT